MGFADHLYEGLKRRGVSPFIDSEKIERLLEYIEKSKVCIPIISKSYADSKWCFKELAQMLEFKKAIPVFFRVDPSDVKLQSGPFSKGFKKHEADGELKDEEVTKWREAFPQVGNRSGYTLKDADGYEAKLVNIIVKKVLDEVNSNDVRTIGIQGMGGIGKTTLAKAIYNKLLSNALIVLDDVDRRNQLLALVGGRDWFRGGSLIIITTRDISPLIEHRVKKDDEIYELTGLSRDDSMKLFCHHAFRSEKPPNKELAELCDEAISSIQGLPLALEVFGSQFFDIHTEKEWRDLLALLKLRQNKDIFERLKLSFDSLTSYEKQIFLDIACFFLGERNWYRWWEVDEEKQFWEGCGFHREVAIDVLKHKALIKISECVGIYDYSSTSVGRWRFEMHDKIRDVGRKIVEEEGKGKSCGRLWKYDDPKVKRALQGEEVRSVEGIVSRGDKMEQVASLHLQVDDLRMFHFEDGRFKGLPRFSNTLKWLGLPNCHHDNSCSLYS